MRGKQTETLVAEGGGGLGFYLARPVYIHHPPLPPPSTTYNICNYIVYVACMGISSVLRDTYNIP